MAVYAALVSLANTIQQVISFDSHSSHQIKSLHEKITSLEEFLENFSQNSSEAIKCLEPKIRDVAYQAEDIIESHMSDISFFCQDLQKAVAGIDSIMEEVLSIQNWLGITREPQSRDGLLPPPAATDTSRPTMRSEKTMVGFDSDVSQIKDRLTGREFHLQIIPIVGMGGIGKTTLARNVYDDKLILDHFDTRAWVILSQNRQIKRILVDLLSCVVDPLELDKIEKLTEKNQENHEEVINETLGGLLYRRLKGWRYLLVMDDMWNGEIWDDLRRYFPDDNNGSRIVATTRLVNVADYINPSSLHHRMHFLNEEESWHLLSQKVFAEDCCPSELKEVGKKIAEKCGGLPLAISVIGGLLQRVGKEQADFWAHVADHVSTYTNTNDEQCSKILLLSYKHLPHHLRACFLYMGRFEDQKIRVSKLIKLWAAEGFLKQTRDKTVEDVAEDYLNDLIDRNLILISEKGSTGKVKSCNMHDLVKDLCIRLCQVEKFLYISDNTGLDGFLEKDTNSERRLVIHASLGSSGSNDLLENESGVLMEFMSRVRSFIFNSSSLLPVMSSARFRNFKLLRVLDAADGLRFQYFPQEILELVHLRYLSFVIGSVIIPSSISLLKNLETLVLSKRGSSNSRFQISSAIWEMPKLRHINFHYGLPQDPVDGKECVQLQSLETLSGLMNFKWSEEIIESFPNLKKLKIWYSSDQDNGFEWRQFCLHNLVRLHKVETLTVNGPILWNPGINEQWITFPRTLRKLSLAYLTIPSNDCMVNIGSLPNLEVLKLGIGWYLTNKIWEPVEGGFARLKFLKFKHIFLEEWRASGTHFPILEHLIIEDCDNLMEIPLSIGDIPTLEVIQLNRCSSSIEDSAKKIQKEQQEWGNGQLRIIIS